METLKKVLSATPKLTNETDETDDHENEHEGTESATIEQNKDTVGEMDVMDVMDQQQRKTEAKNSTSSDSTALSQPECELIYFYRTRKDDFFYKNSNFSIVNAFTD